MADTYYFFIIIVMQNLYTTDYMSVIWEYQVDKWVTNPSEEHKEERIKLIFTIQINGKIKSFEHYFLLERYTPTLKEWNTWYVLSKTLEELWYKIWEEGDLWTTSVMNIWIPQLVDNQ